MIQKTIPVAEMRPGMVLIAHAMGRNGQIVAPAKTVLNLPVARRLLENGVTYLTVSIPDNIATEAELKTQAPYVNILKTSGELKEFRREFLLIANHLSEMFETLLITPLAQVDYKTVVKETLDLGVKYGETLHVIELLNLSRDFDDTMYAHSIGVALIARIIGIKAKLPKDQINKLILCGLMHDIGKIQISDELLYREESITHSEYEDIKTHAYKGYRMLKEANFPEYVCQAALQHHERNDGSGYPTRLRGENISMYAKVIAIADVYDAMTARRAYRKEICPTEVIATFEKEAGTLYESELLLPFLRCIAESMIGAHVILNNRAEGKIIMLGKSLTRPVIQIGDDFLDLLRLPDLSIVEVQ